MHHMNLEIVRLFHVLNASKLIGFAPDLDRKLRKVTKLLGNIWLARMSVRFRSCDTTAPYQYICLFIASGQLVPWRSRITLIAFRWSCCTSHSFNYCASAQRSGLKKRFGVRRRLSHHIKFDVVRLSQVLNGLKPKGFAPDLARKLRKVTKCLGQIRLAKTFVRLRSW